MVRTAGTAIKTAGGKSSKSHGFSGGSFYSAASGSSRKTIGGNKLVQRPIPQWQKPIGSFFNKPNRTTVDAVHLEESLLQSDEVYFAENNIKEHVVKEEIVTMSMDPSDKHENTAVSNRTDEDICKQEIGDTAISEHSGEEMEKLESPNKENHSPSNLKQLSLMSSAYDEMVNTGASTSSKPEIEIKKSPPKRKQLCEVYQVQKRRKIVPNFKLLEEFERENSVNTAK